MADSPACMLWASWRGDPKRKAIKAALGSDAVVAVVDLFVLAGEKYPSGIIPLTSKKLEIALDWESTEGALVGSMLEHGVLEQNADGSFAIHNWKKRQRWMLDANRRKRQAKKAADARWSRNARALQEESGADAALSPPSHTLPPLTSTSNKNDGDGEIGGESEGRKEGEHSLSNAAASKSLALIPESSFAESLVSFECLGRTHWDLTPKHADRLADSYEVTRADIVKQAKLLRDAITDGRRNKVKPGSMPRSLSTWLASGEKNGMFRTSTISNPGSSKPPQPRPRTIADRLMAEAQELRRQGK